MKGIRGGGGVGGWWRRMMEGVGGDGAQGVWGGGAG